MQNMEILQAYLDIVLAAPSLVVRSSMNRRNINSMAFLVT